jgi:uncharacterized membrane protein YadS
LSQGILLAVCGVTFVTAIHLHLKARTNGLDFALLVVWIFGCIAAIALFGLQFMELKLQQVNSIVADTFCTQCC